MERIFLGLDGGGTKTDVMLCDESGRILARAMGGASSITGQTVEEAGRNIRETLDAVLAPFGGRSCSIEGFYAGISGCGIAEIRNNLQNCFTPLLQNVRHFELGSDARSALSSGIGLADGVVAIAGTGSCVYARKAGTLKRFGGWGYLLGDEGSGYDLGRRALACTLRELDGSGPETALTKKCREQAGKPVDEFVSELYRGDAKKIIAAFAPLLLDAVSEGDSAAQSGLKESVSAWGASIRMGLEYCGQSRIVAGGSLWKNECYRQSVKNVLPKNTEIIIPDLPPAFGAVAEAFGLAGFEVSSACFENARKSINNVL